jgi:hypothetical protein
VLNNTVLTNELNNILLADAAPLLMANEPYVVLVSWKQFNSFEPFWYYVTSDEIMVMIL